MTFYLIAACQASAFRRKKLTTSPADPWQLICVWRCPRDSVNRLGTVRLSSDAVEIQTRLRVKLCSTCWRIFNLEKPFLENISSSCSWYGFLLSESPGSEALGPSCESRLLGTTPARCRSHYSAWKRTLAPIYRLRAEDTLSPTSSSNHLGAVRVFSLAEQGVFRTSCSVGSQINDVHW